MPLALLLFADGQFQITVLQGVADYQTIVDGDVELLPFKDSCLTCYVNDECHQKDLTRSPWNRFLIDIGAHISLGTRIMGNIVVLGGVDTDGEETDVPYGVIKRVYQYGDEKM